MANRETLRQSIAQRQEAHMTKEYLYDLGKPELQEQAEAYDEAHMDELHEIALEDNQEGSDFQKTADERMEYAETFDGTQEVVTDEEREKATNDFNAFVDDMLLRDAEHVKTYQGTIQKGKNQSSLLLTTTQKDGSRISIGVKSQSSDGETSAQREISVQKIGSDGYGGQYHRYFVDDEGTLRRFDTDLPKSSEEREQRAMSLRLEKVAMNVDPIGTIEQKIADIGEMKKNLALERQIGVNEQPVSPEEVAKLQLLLVDAHVQKTI